MSMSKKSKSAEMKYILERNSNSTIFALYAEHLLSKHNLFDALTVAKRGVIANPNYVMGHIILAQAYQKEQDFRQALQELTIALKLEPNNTRALSMIATILEKEDEDEAAHLVYGIIERINPSLKVLRHKSAQHSSHLSIISILDSIGSSSKEKMVHEEIPYEQAKMDGITLSNSEPQALILTPTDATVEIVLDGLDSTPPPAIAPPIINTPAIPEESGTEVDADISPMLSVSDETVEFTLPTPAPKEEIPVATTITSTSTDFNLDDFAPDIEVEEEVEEHHETFSDNHLADMLSSDGASTQSTPSENPFDDFKNSLEESLTVLNNEAEPAFDPAVTPSEEGP